MENNDMNSLNKDIIPLFDPIDWELKVHNMNYLIKSKNKIMNFKDLKNNEKLKSFIKSIEDDLENKKNIKLIKLNNESEKQKIEQEHKQNLEENILNKYKELQELLSVGTSKLVQKQNANKYLTDIIDRDENIKRACMYSLYKIYSSFLYYNMLESMVKLLSDSFENGLKIIEDLKRINPNNQMEEYVFSYSHKIISNKEQIDRLKRIDRLNRIREPYFQIDQFRNLYYDIIQLYKEIYDNRITISNEDEVFIRQIYLSFIQDFFIFYVKGSGALYLLFTSDDYHKQTVEPAKELGDLFDITNEECFINKNDEKISLLDYFNSLNLGNSDWDLNLCINPGLYEKLYDKFIDIYQFILNWNRTQMYICREKYFIKNQYITNCINDFFKQVNYDYISELSESMIENGDKLIQDDGTIIITQSEIGIAFIERSELDSTIYRIVSENDIKNNKQLVGQIGKSYNIPWLGSESNENDSDLLLEDIIMKKETYQNVKNFIKEMFTETSSTSIKYTFNNNQLDNNQLDIDNNPVDIHNNPVDISFSNIGRTFYIQYNDSIDAFGLLRLSFLGVNTIKNKINNSTAGAGELLDISFIKDYNEMKSDWEHRDLLINDLRLPLLDYWDIIMDLNITMRDNVLQGNLKKINKRLDRLRYLQSILCCKANIEKNIGLLAQYYSRHGKEKCQQNVSIDKNNCYWDDEKILLFLESDDRRMKKFGVLLTKLQQVDDNIFNYPYNSDIRNYIIQQFQKSNNIEPSEEEIYKNSIGFAKQKIEAINTSLRYNPKLNILSNRIQNKYELTPYISNLISKLYIYCDKQLSKDQNEIKLSAETLFKYFGPREESRFIIPDKKEDYLNILGIYLMHLNKYKQGIDFLIDQIFLGNDNNTNHKLNFRNFLNSIISSLDIITGNYFGFTWIIYKENILTNNSKNLLYQEDGTHKSRPYIDNPVYKTIANDSTSKCFFTSLILDYCINIYEQLLMVLLTKEINSSTYIEFNNEMSNKNFEDIFNNMVTDIHILEFMVKYKSVNNLDLTNDFPIYNFVNHKKFNYDIYFNDPLYQITFIPELRNNPFYNVNKNGRSIYDKTLVDFLRDNNIVEPSLATRVTLNPALKKIIPQSLNDDLSILGYLVSKGIEFNGKINELFINVKDQSDILDIITDKNNQELFDNLSFDYNDKDNDDVNVMKNLISYLSFITYALFSRLPFFIYFMCIIKYQYQTPKLEIFLTSLYEDATHNVLTDNMSYKILAHQNDVKFYLFNIVNDNYNFYNYNFNIISKHTIFYNCCHKLNQINYKTFFPISRLFYIQKQSTIYNIFEENYNNNNSIELGIINDTDKEEYYLKMKEMINYYFDNSFVDDENKSKIIEDVNTIFTRINEILKSSVAMDTSEDPYSLPGDVNQYASSGDAMDTSEDPYSFLGGANQYSSSEDVNKYASSGDAMDISEDANQYSFPEDANQYSFPGDANQYSSNLQKILRYPPEPFKKNQGSLGGGLNKKNTKNQSGGDFVDYSNDFIGKILHDLVVSRLNIESGKKPLVSIPNGIKRTDFIRLYYQDNMPVSEHTFPGSINLSTIDMKFNFVANISIFKSDPTYITLNSMKDYISSQIKINNILINNDINTANQFLMSYFLSNIYKLIFLDLQNSTNHDDSIVYKNIILSVDPLTLSQNVITPGDKRMNRYPVFPIEITITCNENIFYKNILKKNIKKYINNINIIKSILYNDGRNVVLYNYIVYIVNILNYNQDCNNLEQINSISRLYKGRYYRKYNDDLIFRDFEIETDYDENMDTLKLVFKIIYTLNNRNKYFKIGTIIISSSDNLYKYGFNEPKNISTNIIGIPILYDSNVFLNFLKDYQVSSGGIEYFLHKFDQEINIPNRNYFNILWNQNMENIYISEYNKFYKYYKNELNQLKTLSNNLITPTDFLVCVNRVYVNELKDKYKIYKDFIGIENKDLIMKWESIINNLIFFPIFDKNIDKNIDTNIIPTTTFMPYNSNGFTNIYNTYLLQHNRINVRELGDENFSSVRNKLQKIPIDSISGGGPPGDSYDSKDIKKYVSSNSFNNTIKLNDTDTKQLLVYNDDLKNIEIEEFTNKSLPKYGTNIYYENNTVSQVDEGITKVYISELSLDGIELTEKDNIILLEGGENIYFLSYPVDTKLSDIDNDSIFNIINNFPNKVVKINYDYEQDIEIDEEEYYENEQDYVINLKPYKFGNEIYMLNNIDMGIYLQKINIKMVNDNINGEYVPLLEYLNKEMSKQAEIYKNLTNNISISITLSAGQDRDPDVLTYYYIFKDNKTNQVVGFIQTNTNQLIPITNYIDNFYININDEWKKHEINIVESNEVLTGGKNKKRTTIKNKKKRCNLTKNKKCNIKKCKTNKFGKKHKKFTINKKLKNRK